MMRWACIHLTRESSVGARVMMVLEAHGHVAACGRAEDGVQRVAFGRDVVTVSRRIAGLETKVNIPTSSFRGVTLKAAHDGSFDIVLLHVDPGLSVPLSHAPDDADVIASWREFGRLTGLPLLVEDADGRLQPMIEDRPSSPAPRRLGSPLRTRRPRFLAARAAGVSGPTVVHATGCDLFARAQSLSARRR
jgi:hypothetical protein